MVDEGSKELKYKAIMAEIQRRSMEGELAVGDALPSITAISREFSCARETAAKAYNLMKKYGIITSYPGKGFFLLSDKRMTLPKVFLMLNNLTPYMEVLYNSFMAELEGKAKVEVFFHHNNIEMFKDIIDKSYGNYYTYLVKGFEHEEVEAVLERFSDDELLVLDRREGINETRSYIAQSYEEDFYRCLTSNCQRFKKYEAVYLVFGRSQQSHPKMCIPAFEHFLRECGIRGGCITHLDASRISPKECFIALADDDLVALLKKCRKENYVMGEDIGIVSYNDTPMKEFVGEGITVFTADFVDMGKMAAQFALDPKPVRYDVYARTVLRKSL